MRISAAKPTIEDTFKLPCGLVLQNRLAKAAMSEALATPDGRPSERLLRLYRRWGGSGLGLMVTGNAVIDRVHVERPGNVIIEDESSTAQLARWAEAGAREGAAMILQINHAGRQTMRWVNPRPTAPSSVPALKVLRAFGRPRAATLEEIAELRRRFCLAARVAEAAGFAGVQIHAAHGYLLNQFLAPDANRRDDDYGGSIDNRARLLLEIVRAVRAQSRPSFAVTVKLNTRDFHEGGLSFEDALSVVRLLEHEGVDLLELSGGTYVKGASFGDGVDTRGAYFLTFAERVRAQSRLPLMLTGGLRSRADMEQALAAADVVGMGRPLALEPELPRRILDRTQDSSTAKPMRFALAGLRGAAELAWYSRQLHRIADGKEPDARLSPALSLLLRLWTDWRAARRHRRAGSG